MQGREVLSVLAWEEPPTQTRTMSGREVSHGEVALTLIQNPGDWARILDTANIRAAQQLVTQIKNGRLAAFRSAFGRYDAVSRTSEGITSVYARYVPDDR